MLNDFKSFQEINISNSEDLEKKEYSDDLALQNYEKNGYIANAIRTYQKNTIGSSFIIDLKQKNKRINIDYIHKLEDEFMIWFNSVFIDVQRKRTGSEILQEAVKHYILTGEIFIAKGFKKHRFISSCFDLISNYRVSFDIYKNGFVAGIKSDKYGEEIEYAITNRKNSNKYQIIKAYNNFNEKQILHLSNRIFGYDQVRGVSMLYQINKTLCKSEDLSSSILDSAIEQTKKSMYIKSDSSAEAMAQAFPDMSYIDTVTEAYNSSCEFYNCKDTGVMNIDGSIVPILKTGDSIETVTMTIPNNDLVKYGDSLHEIASTGLGIAKEQYTGNHENTSYNSARSSQSSTWGTFELFKKNVVDKIADFFFMAFLFEKRLSGNILYFDDFKVSWNGASKPIVDDVKDAKAKQIRLQTGEITQKDMLAQNGKDWKDNIKQQVAEAELLKKTLEEKGISLKDYATYKQTMTITNIATAEQYSKNKDED